MDETNTSAETKMSSTTRTERASAIVTRNMNLIVDLTADYASDLRAEIMAHHVRIPNHVNVPGLVHGPVHKVDGLVNLHVWGTGETDDCDDDPGSHGSDCGMCAMCPGFGDCDDKGGDRG